jgi:hypothetical protein
MKLRQTRYVPKRPKRTLLKVLDVIMVILLVLLWLNKDKFGITSANLLIISGFIVLGITLASMNRKKDKENTADDEFLAHMRDEIGKENYMDTDFFFGKEDK